MRKITGELMREAHKLTKEIVREYPNTDYKFQLGLCISYLLAGDVEEKLTKEKVIDQLNKVAYENDMYSYATDWVKGEHNRTYFKLTWYTGNRYRGRKHEKQCGYWDNNTNKYCLENRYTRQYNVFEL